MLEGEVGYVTDDPNQYKIGDGVHAWNDLPLRGFDGTLVHELGTSQTAAMSQQGVTYTTNAIDRVLQGSSRFALENKMGNEISLTYKTSTYIDKSGKEVTGISSFTTGEYSLTEDDRNTNSYLVCDFIFAGNSATAVAYYDSEDNFIGTHDFTGLSDAEAYRVKTILRTDEKVAKIKLCGYKGNPKLYKMYPNDNNDLLHLIFGNNIEPTIVEPDTINVGKKLLVDGTLVDQNNTSIGIFNDLSGIDKLFVYSYTNQGVYNIAYYDADDNFLFRHPIQGLQGGANYYRVKMLLHKYNGIAKVKLSGYKEKPKLFSIPLYGVEDSNISSIKNIIGDYNSINDYTSIQDSLTQIDGHYLNNSGVVSELNNFAYTDYYSAEDIVSLRVDTRLGTALGIIFWYDEYYNILSSVTPKVSSGGVVKSVYSEKPEGAVWFRTSYYTNDGLDVNVYAAYGQKDLITYINEKEDNNSSIENLKRIVFIPIYGQSLSVGGESSPAITTKQKYNSLKFNTGIISRPSSPDSVTSFVPLTETSTETSASGTGEMFVEALMRENALYAYSTKWDDVQLLFVCPGQGSSNIAYLSNDEEGGYYNYFKNCLQAAKNICDANGYTIEVPAWCWIQGETDLKEENTKDTYYTALLALQNKINSDIKSIIGQTEDVKCICYQTGCQCLYTQDYSFSNNQMDVLTAQMEAVRDNDAFMASIPMYIMDHVIGANIHITNISEKLLGAYQGYVLKRYLIDGEVNKGVCPLSFTVSGNDILVKYSVPCPPLEFDTNYVRETENMGYTCIKSDNSDIIESVSLYNDTVTIHCSESPVGCKLRYALNGESIVISPSTKTGNSGREYGGRGNLRDSQGYHVYKDIEGSKYPLHNWAYAFEHII